MSKNTVPSSLKKARESSLEFSRDDSHHEIIAQLIYQNQILQSELGTIKGYIIFYTFLLIFCAVCAVMSLIAF